MEKNLKTDLEKEEDFKAVEALLMNKEYVFSKVMSSMGDLISIHDINMRIVYQNDAMKVVFGNFPGKFCFMIYEKKEIVCEDCPMQEAFKDGNVHRAIRIGVLPDGTTRRFENVAAVLKDKQNIIIGGIEIVRDVEERESTREKLIASNRQLSVNEQQLRDNEQKLKASQKELTRKVSELESFNRLMVGRELEMIELKKEINSLCKELKRPNTYEV